MKRAVICICIITISTSCVLKRTTGPSNGRLGADRPETITVFFTGNELGALKPCGCSGGQLGGLDRRSAVFNSMPEEQRLIIDTGTLVISDSKQDLIKFDIIIQAFLLLGYDLISFSEKDLEIIKDYKGSLEVYNSILNIIAPAGPTGLTAPAKFTQRFEFQDKTIDVSIATIDVNSTPIEFFGEAYFPASEPEAPNQQVNILVLNRCDPELIDSVAEKVPAVDCLICPSESDEPTIISDPNKRPLAFSVGRKGRYISKLQIEAAKNENKPKLSFQYQPVTGDLDQDQELITLYKDYQQIVKKQNLLEEHDRFRLTEGLHYASSESCSTCHPYEYVEWMGKPHANAYATLEEVGSQYDPECVKCHVVGMDYESGFFSEQKTPLMKDVGCEVCHGPGSKHNAYPNEITMPIAEPNSVCSDCHTPEHSDDYLGHEEEKLQLIKHWLEPNDVSDVK